MKRVIQKNVRTKLPVRLKKSSKIDGGKVLIIGGGKGLYGAGILAALAATKAGAGYTYLMTGLEKYNWLKFPDFIIHPFSVKFLKNHFQSAIGIGPGMGITNLNKRILNFLIKYQIPKVVVDGDALTILSTIKVKKLPETWILTPHEGELGRLLGVSSLKIKADRLHYALEAQKKFGCIIILKGADTLIVNSKNVYLVNNGSPALAKAGSGDVLLGIITAFLAQGLDPVEAAKVGCFIHGDASKLWVKGKRDYLSMRPVDLIELLPFAIYQIRKTKN